MDSDDSHLLLLSASSYDRRRNTCLEHHFLHWDTPDFGEYSMLSTPVISLRVGGTCNGLVLLLKGRTSPVLVWNPSIRKIVNLPKPRRSRKCDYSERTSHGFGYDSISNDYKILRLVTLDDDHSTIIYIYSLAKGSWKSLHGVDKSVDWHARMEEGDGPVFVNGSFHMLQVRKGQSGTASFMGTFNLATEVFGEIIIPEALRKGRCSKSRYRDSLAFIKYYDYRHRDPADRGCDGWVMKQYGVAESWTYLSTVSVGVVSIHGFKRCGEVVLCEYNDRGMISVDPKTKQVKEFEIKDHIYYFMDPFVESIVLPDHANAISYLS